MTANNCDDAFQRDQELQRQRAEEAQRLEDLKRQQKAADDAVRARPGQTVIVPGRDGPLDLNTGDIQQAHDDLPRLMGSQYVSQLVDRGIDLRARPLGAEGRFQNYDRLLREVDIRNADDYLRLGEALGLTHERLSPEDYTFITQKYGREKLISILSRYFEELGASDAGLLAEAASRTAPVLNAVENKLWLRFYADQTKRLWLETAEEIRTQMAAIPGGEIPAELKQELFKRFKLALALERNNNLVSRRHAQALRSQQEEILGLEQFRLKLDDPELNEIRGALEMTGKDIGPDSAVGQMLEAVDNNDPKQLEFLIDTAEIDAVDPKTKLDENWLNTYLRMSNALVKDSQLANPNSQWLNLGSNGIMMIFGPVEQTFYNGVRLAPVGTRMTRESLMESWRISAQAHNLAWTTLKGTWRYDWNRVFQSGVSHYSGNLDTYGKNLLTNKQELQDMQQVLDTPYRPAPTKLGQLANPENVAIFGNKLQAAARILVLTKPNGIKGVDGTGVNRLEAAWTALGFQDARNGVQRLRAENIEMRMPWKPALRAMAGVDEVAGRFHYMFKLKADLEVKARVEGAQLGLLTDRDRAEWVQNRIDEAIYSATPKESDIIAFRRQHGLKGSDFTNAQIAEMLAERNLAGAPTLATKESVDAMQYSAQKRFQDPVPGRLNEGMQNLRKDWHVDRYLFPYWQSPFAGLHFDMDLGTFGLKDSIRMATGMTETTPELVARAKAAKVMGGALFAAFGVLDAAGQIGGGLDSDPDRRNTLFGFRLAGFPVLNTLFLWKDLKEALINAQANDYDAQVVGSSVLQVLTAQIMRQTGVQQLQLLLDAMLDGNKSALEKAQSFAGFMASSQIPGIGLIRTVERNVGMTRNDLYRDEPGTAYQNYMLGQGDALVIAEQALRNLLTDTLPLASGLLGGKRKETDHLGTPRGHINGVNLAKAFPMFFPSVWPKGKMNEVVYSELDTQDRLDPPDALLRRNLEGIAMSDDLQWEYNDIHGKIKGPAEMPPSARLQLSGKDANLTFNFPVDVVTTGGMRIRKTESKTIKLDAFLDQFTRGRTKKEAFYALFTSDYYQKLQDDPTLTSQPPGGLPPALARRATAQKLIQGLTNYYHLLTTDELERRAAQGTSPAAQQWSAAKSELTRREMGAAVKSMEATGRILPLATP